MWGFGDSQLGEGGGGGRIKVFVGEPECCLRTSRWEAT